MEPLTWSGALGPFLNPIMLAALVVFALGFVTNMLLTLAGVRAGEVQINPDHTLTMDRTPVDYALMAMKYAVLLFVACCVGYIVGGMVMLFGARMAGGCTSGHGISGSLQLAASSWTFFMVMFASGVATAWLLFGRVARQDVAAPTGGNV